MGFVRSFAKLAISQEKSYKIFLFLLQKKENCLKNKLIPALFSINFLNCQNIESCDRKLSVLSERRQSPMSMVTKRSKTAV